MKRLIESNHSAALAFASYARVNDEADDGHVLALCNKLKVEVRVQSGDNAFEIFYDKKDVTWGQDWENRLNEGLSIATFLLPIITPHFLNSTACQEEVLRFGKLEAARCRNDLIMPVYYVSDPRFEQPEKLPNGPVRRTIELLRKHQFEDWRGIRSEDIKAASCRKKIELAAAQLKLALERWHQDIRQVTVSPTGMRREIVVDARTPAFYPSIEDALRDAQAGEDIIVRQPLSRVRELLIDKPVRILGRSSEGRPCIETSGKFGIKLAASSNGLESLCISHTGEDDAAVLIETSKASIDDCEISADRTPCIRTRPGKSVIANRCSFVGGRYAFVAEGETNSNLARCSFRSQRFAAAYLLLGGSLKIEDCDFETGRPRVWKL